MTEESAEKAHDVDVVICGGGVAGLWTLNHLINKGYHVILVEKNRLGEGQTIKCQGIIHGGGKYALKENLRLDSVREIREMPARWRKHLSGEASPDLSGVRLLSDYCYLWISNDRGFLGHASALISKAGVKLLSTKPIEVNDAPAFLKDNARIVYKLGEPTIDTYSLLKELAKPYPERIIYGSILAVELEKDFLRSVTIETETAEKIQMKAKAVILTAGKGNAELAKMMGIAEEIMQERPLRQVLVQGGNLPELYAHCIDSGTTDISITTHYGQDGSRAWNIGGKVAEKGPSMNPEELIRKVKEELGRVLKTVDLTGTTWSTFDATRAELKTNDGTRPGGVEI